MNFSGPQSHQRRLSLISGAKVAWGSLDVSATGDRQLGAGLAVVRLDREQEQPEERAHGADAKGEEAWADEQV